ncbi:MAG TPA: hypothetical protein PLG59_00335 [bacterium]|nr:hypothetical protein [bacterium]HQP97824.1 hypothetical protein [bacterium]
MRVSLRILLLPISGWRVPLSVRVIADAKFPDTQAGTIAEYVGEADHGDEERMHGVCGFS